MIHNQQQEEQEYIYAYTLLILSNSYKVQKSNMELFYPG